MVKRNITWTITAFWDNRQNPDQLLEILEKN